MITFTKQAIRELKKIPANTRKLILSKIEQLYADPASLANNIKKLQGVDACRLRIGDYRVIYNQSGEILLILRIAHRGGVYD